MNEVLLLQFCLAVGLWTLASLGWWIFAAFLGGMARKKEREFIDDFYCIPRSQDLEAVSVFKALPRFAGKGPGANCRLALMTFFKECAQPGCELILGVHFEDAVATQIWLDQVLDAKVTGLRLKVIYRDSPDTCANPKVAWLERLASEATHGLWLWSDADIMVREGWLMRFRQEWAAAERQGRNLISSSYVVPSVEHLAGLLDMMYVNAEFYPGVRLLQNLGSVDFALGAACLFRRSQFERAGGFSKIRDRIADDYALGQMLSPCAVATERVMTFPSNRDFPGAVEHYFRWQKTVRWNKPGAYFAQLFIQPLWGWIFLTLAVALLAGPLYALVPGVGLVTLFLTEALFPALAASQAVAGKLDAPRGASAALFAWNLLRYVAWINAWLPSSVKWAGKIWSHPVQAPIKEGV